VQDLFAILWTQKENLQIKSSLKSYLYSSIRNSALNYKKKKNFLLPQLLTKPSRQNVQESPEDSYIKKEMHIAVHQAIQKLPEKCRQIYLMKRYENMQYSEIAEILSISVNTVKTQMNRAMKSLQKYLAHLMTCLISLMLLICYHLTSFIES
jgi:RNA polymerase sigma-70 factor (ECF subfamily)